MKNENRDYLIIGSGRLARHLQNYFKLSGFSFQTWNRKDDSEDNFKIKATSAKWILLAISDSALLNFRDKFTEHTPKMIHFSGSLQIPGVTCFHPMMSFADTLYDLQQYQLIHFAEFHSNLKFKHVFPDLKNSTFQIKEDQKALYHALCSFSGNLTGIIWKLSFNAFKNIGVSESAVKSYQNQNLMNLLNSPLSDIEKVLTGPIVRGDTIVIHKQTEELQKFGFDQIYQECEKLYGASLERTESGL